MCELIAAHGISWAPDLHVDTDRQTPVWLQWRSASRVWTETRVPRMFAARASTAVSYNPSLVVSLWWTMRSRT